MQQKQEVDNFGLFAVSKVLARARNGMTMPEKKLCCLALSKVAYYANSENPLEIWLDADEIMKGLKINIGQKHISDYLRDLAFGMKTHSEIKFDKADRSAWRDMPLFTERSFSRGKLMVRIYDKAYPLLNFLVDGSYTTFFLQDILCFESDENGKRAFLLYEKLRVESDTRIENTKLLTVEQLKELWDIPKSGKGSYIRENGRLDRSAFEKRVLNSVFKQLSECKHVKVLQNEDGSYYQKPKKYGIVTGYLIRYRINFPKKPERSEKSGSTKSKLQKYNNFQQRDYDYAEMERLLANSPNN